MKSSIIYIIAGFLLGAIPAQSQPLPKGTRIISWDEKPETYALFPKKAEETSGLIWLDQSIWTFNDSGGKPELYRISEKGDIIQTIKINGAKNVDWEDITQDENQIYIGDFGNNLGNREDLTIYVLPKSRIGDEEETEINVDAIYFHFADQKDFSVRNRKNDYDCEALTCFGDSLLLFSKNWGDGKSRLYKLGKNPGRYSPEPRATFNADGLVTGASYNPENGTLALIGYKNFVPFIWIIENFDGVSFQANNIYRINLVGLTDSQTEGICWQDRETLLISTEARNDFQQGAYRLDLNMILKKGTKAP
ncbi:MAG: hypothetical protein KQI35_01065 [Bacteroidetes bacterium]|nr:hypothetical protein [Bacteroidota bacterium]